MTDPFAPYTKDKFIEIARAIYKLIAKRSIILAKEDAIKLAKDYAWEIIEHGRFLTYDDIIDLLGEIDIEAPSSPYKTRKQQIANIKKICITSENLLNAVKENKSLLQLELKLNEDIIIHLMGGLDQFTWAAKDFIDNGLKRGPNNKIEITEFIETITIIFKEASGLSITEINKLPIKERRAWKGQYFDFLEKCRFEGHLLYSKEALRKNAERYLEKNDPIRNID